MSENEAALTVAYYIAKYDELAYKHLGYDNQGAAHKVIAEKLLDNENANTLKNMRDEFDAIFPNTKRAGWYQKPLSKSRVHIHEKYVNLSEPELYAVVSKYGVVQNVFLKRLTKIKTQANKLFKPCLILAAINSEENRFEKTKIKEKYKTILAEKNIQEGSTFKDPYEGLVKDDIWEWVEDRKVAQFSEEDWGYIQENRDEVIQFIEDKWFNKSISNDKRYWLYAPGEGANKWEEFYNEGIMGLGWDSLDDLKSYESKDEIEKTLQALNNTSKRKSNDATANDQFANEMKVGDVVIVKKGTQTLLGWGEVVSDYIYDDERESYKHLRKVAWQAKGLWPIDFNLAIKTLTDLTPYEGDDPQYDKFYQKVMATFERKEITKKLNEKFSTSFNQDCGAHSLKLSNQLSQNFTSALMAKPFTILTGLSGSGKTQIARAFSKWLSCSEELQTKVVAVGADWTSNENLLGYPDALSPGQYRKPDNGTLDLILDAKDDPERPYFLILDEMNLSHVERYFADFLSAIESGEPIHLHDATEADWNGVPAELKLPKNLFVIGTVNVDETTYMFSPKVLDRANVIEFRVSEDEIANFLEDPKKPEIDNLAGLGAKYAKSFVEHAKTEEFTLDASVKGEVTKVLVELFPKLQRCGAEFGYRTAHEICRFIYFHQKFSPQVKAFDFDGYIAKHKKTETSYDISVELSGLLRQALKIYGNKKNLAEAINVFLQDDYIKEPNFTRYIDRKRGARIIVPSVNSPDKLKAFFEVLKKENLGLGSRKVEKDLDLAIDAAIMQKLLPKLHGSRKKLGPVLEQLLIVCTPSKDEEDIYRFSVSAAKIQRMQKRLMENGFTSFAEA
ncbi:hypothetical protein PQO03_17040 [Lentisphaera profundi]|uniref:AAA+ ATPase domain-containing protein n=1 Tax=Lentisphaera profundi TaxID=1658616 RepID=A0ABY7VUW3_9BACT|nr:hypothetical protein [Lentisphaera profundi]WDE97534.1 hypothetical protein PQO03_17040 [Lentisphaera profundi]